MSVADLTWLEWLAVVAVGVSIAVMYWTIAAGFAVAMWRGDD